MFLTEVNETEVNGNLKATNQIEWILDSGCTDHIINDDRFYEMAVLLKNPVSVKLGDGRMMNATKIGRVNSFFVVNGQEHLVTMNNAYFVRQMKHNLLSYAKVTVNNTIMSYENISKVYNSREELIAIARKENNIYRMTSFIKKPQASSQANSSQLLDKIGKITEKERWHRTLGHVNFKYLDTLCRNELFVGLPKNLESEEMKCAIRSQRCIIFLLRIIDQRRLKF